MTPALTFTVAFAALSAGHWLADYWVQTSSQALTKGEPGWTGRRACAAHVATHTLTLAACIRLASMVLAISFSWPHVVAGLLVSAVTHYLADRRVHLARAARILGKEDYWANGGAEKLDQSFHWFCLFIAALVIAG